MNLKAKKEISHKEKQRIKALRLKKVLPKKELFFLSHLIHYKVRHNKLWFNHLPKSILIF